MQKITTYLWFDEQAEEAANFYVSVFQDGRIVDVKRFGAVGPGPDGSPMAITFELFGQRFVALNGGPAYTFNAAISLFVDCADQSEVDDLWAKLTADGGRPVQCGWLKDKFGVWWQIIPKALTDLIGDPDPEKAGRVMVAMLQMIKIDVNQLQAAYHAV